MKESQTHDDGSVRVLGDKTKPFASTLWEAGFTVYSNAKLDTKKTSVWPPMVSTDGRLVFLVRRGAGL